MPNDPSEDLADAGSLLSLVAAGRARSRAELAEVGGLSRTTVVHRLKALLDAGLLQESDETQATGGRPSRLLAVNAGFGVVLAADVGETSVRIAVTDLTPVILAESMIDVDLGAGPVPVLDAIATQFSLLLGRIGRRPAEVIGAGLSLPAPVDFASGRVFGPSVMAGWDGFDIRGWLERRLDAPVLVENDVNLMTLYEWKTFWPGVGHLFYIKAGTGIGSGIIFDGHIYRGAQGAAGDIGHIQLGGRPQPLCRCGKRGCVEARAAGWALARDLRTKGHAARNARDVVALALLGDADALGRLGEAGRVLGEVTADVVSVLNPGVIVLGGTLSEIDRPLLEGMRSVVEARALPLARRGLRIVKALSGADAGLLGAAALVAGARLDRDSVDATIARFVRSVSAGAR
jgi:predicted NBD/HSP70 family sugar kinase